MSDGMEELSGGVDVQVETVSLKSLDEVVAMAEEAYQKRQEARPVDERFFDLKIFHGKAFQTTVFVCMLLLLFLAVVFMSNLQDVQPSATSTVEAPEEFCELNPSHPTCGRVPCEDTDDDGLCNIAENQFGTDPENQDSDRDGMCDGWEALFGKRVYIEERWIGEWNIDPNDPSDADEDPDRDGLTNLEEFTYGRTLNTEESCPSRSPDPNNNDTDFDGMEDGFEVTWGMDPLNPNDAQGDSDGDGLSNLMEASLGTDPLGYDADRDQLSDPYEAGLEWINITNLAADEGRIIKYTCTVEPGYSCEGTTFQDWLATFYPADLGKTLDPISDDTDGDLMPDGWEWYYGLNPVNFTDAEFDLDKDGLSNVREAAEGTDPKNNDTDGDLLNDGWEARYGLSPVSADTDGNGILDGMEDPDSDGIDLDGNGVRQDIDLDGNGVARISDGDLVETFPNWREHKYDTDPFNSDTDGDGLNDFEEVVVYSAFHVDPSSKDPDNDKLLDPEEVEAKTDASKKDTDGEGLTDYEEVKEIYGYKTDPLKADTDQDHLNDFKEVKGFKVILLGTGGLMQEGSTNISGENKTIQTNPLNPDTDGDGLLDGYEVGESVDFDVWAPGKQWTNPTANDTDDDGMMDGWEFDHSDPDGDGMPSWWEDLFGLDPFNAIDKETDNDDDGLYNYQEYLNYTNPNDEDSDDDGLIDGGEENAYGNGSFIDLDGDGKREKGEVNTYFTDPDNRDTDGDGLIDGGEKKAYGFEDEMDLNGDEVIEKGEINSYGSDPFVFDTDALGRPFDTATIQGGTASPKPKDPNKPWADPWANAVVQPMRRKLLEMNLTVSPLNPDDGDWDLDNDSLKNKDEASPALETDPNDPDMDRDGMPDGWEVKYRKFTGTGFSMDPKNGSDGESNFDNDGFDFSGLASGQPCFVHPQAVPKCEADGVIEGKEYLTNREEYMYGQDLDGNGYNELTTDPAAPMTDLASSGNPIDDGYAIFWSDRDGDGIPNGYEEFYDMNPFDPTDALANFDGDGRLNIDEYLEMKNPRKAD